MRVCSGQPTQVRLAVCKKKRGAGMARRPDPPKLLLRLPETVAKADANLVRVHVVDLNRRRVGPRRRIV